MTASKTDTAKTKASKTGQSDTAAKHAGKDARGESKDNVAQAAFGRVREAIPSLDDVTDGIRAHTDVDLPTMADDAAQFVRRNPAASLAVAAGVGVLIGVLAARRT